MAKKQAAAVGTADYYNPFDASDRQSVEQCQDAVRQLDGFFQRCVNCGLPVQDAQAKLADLRDFFDRLHSQFLAGL